jgi:hypothetical protein
MDIPLHAKTHLSREQRSKGPLGAKKAGEGASVGFCMLTEMQWPKQSGQDL